MNGKRIHYKSNSGNYAFRTKVRRKKDILRIIVNESEEYTRVFYLKPHQGRVLFDKGQLNAGIGTIFYDIKGPNEQDKKELRKRLWGRF